MIPLCHLLYYQLHRGLTLSNIQCGFTTKDHIDYMMKNMGKRMRRDVRYGIERGLVLNNSILSPKSRLTFFYEGNPAAICCVPTKIDPTLWVIYTDAALKEPRVLHRCAKLFLKTVIDNTGLVRIAQRKTNHISMKWVKKLGFKETGQMFKGYIVMEKK